ncbi:DMT family transporter [Deinococcus cellulosilyticus]|uniref:QacE family quaternary ammonium compound efflux SMR transporter n=1 Tax=Deinococcus cellulosilyticus (strain DSM 18568 / NBRC 106333 / KACC 11606 / 5516J-15) TaxID=1223518 RepID=A0A511N9V0_DEIC1|nr:multidrug efflux SMR transporter [Deinococcus cellulosilyticus]GEM49151.1 QacE family quaternary ammonium compound efflux SMR transporter [Deinococcus cellulosilyticus NBRC 106333 = KACC 11606]
MNRAWLDLALAGVLEVVFTVALKLSSLHPPRHPLVLSWREGLAMLAAYLSFHLLSRALRHVPLGTAYLIWTGLGAAGTVLVGWVFFGEALSAARVGCIVVLLVAMMGLKTTSS